MIFMDIDDEKSCLELLKRNQVITEIDEATKRKMSDEGMAFSRDYPIKAKASKFVGAFFKIGIGIITAIVFNFTFNIFLHGIAGLYNIFGTQKKFIVYYKKINSDGVKEVCVLRKFPKDEEGNIVEDAQPHYTDFLYSPDDWAKYTLLINKYAFLSLFSVKV